MAEETPTAKEQLNWAKAGYVEPEPDQETVEHLLEEAGVEQEGREPLHLYERLVERDQERRDELEPAPPEARPKPE